MFAFTSLSTGHTVKVYGRADDWRVFVYDPHGVRVSEHWFSQCPADRPGSLYRTLYASEITHEERRAAYRSAD
jgi:hypothetical protein